MYLVGLKVPSLATGNGLVLAGLAMLPAITCCPKLLLRAPFRDKHEKFFTSKVTIENPVPLIIDQVKELNRRR